MTDYSDYDMQADTMTLVVRKDRILLRTRHGQHCRVVPGTWKSSIEAGRDTLPNEPVDKAEFDEALREDHMLVEYHPGIGMARVYKPYVDNEDFQALADLLFTCSMDEADHRDCYAADEDELKVLDAVSMAAANEDKYGTPGGDFPISIEALAEMTGLPEAQVNAICTRFLKAEFFVGRGNLNATTDRKYTL